VPSIPFDAIPSGPSRRVWANTACPLVFGTEHLELSSLLNGRVLRPIVREYGGASARRFSVPVQAESSRDAGRENGAEQMRNEMMESKRLERDAEMIRANLAETLIKLRALFTPRHAVDQLFDLSSDSKALKILRNLRDKTVANPLAVGIVGLGMAWLMFSSGREESRQHETLDQARRWILSDDAERDVMAAESREELKITAQKQDEGIKSHDVLDEWRRTGNV
jgi:hypothetical protein